jgi:hypothetical protein
MAQMGLEIDVRHSLVRTVFSSIILWNNRFGMKIMSKWLEEVLWFFSTVKSG